MSDNSIPWRRSTDPESPTFEPTAALQMHGKLYYVHLDVWHEIARLQGIVSGREYICQRCGIRQGPPKTEVDF